MELTHQLTYNDTTTAIDEPIGFDNLQVELKRHDLHGISAEVSVGELEFYGQAATIIRQAYQTDIDSEVMYEVYADSTLLYSGKCDLSTYHEQQSDYWSVSVKVGEIGVKTTFNNRIDTEIDLNSPKTVDGDPVETPDWLSLHIPMRHLPYTNKSERTFDFIPNELFLFIDERWINYIFIELGDSITNEYGNFGESIDWSNHNFKTRTRYDGQKITYDANAFYTRVEDPKEVPPQYYPNEEIGVEKKYGDNPDVAIDIQLNITMDNVYVEKGAKFTIEALIFDENNIGTTISGNTIKVTDPYEQEPRGVFDFEFRLQGKTKVNNSIRYYIKADLTECQYFQELKEGKAGRYSTTSQIVVTIKAGSFIKLLMYDNLKETEVLTNMLRIHDVANIITHAITENSLSIKSEWYQSPESKWNAGTTGGGALKALTNGYHIRNLFTDLYNDRNMPLSFKDLIASLNALDCIGWGFSTEDDTTYLRLERWDWFYKDEVVLILTNIAEMQIDITPDHIITELKIGYKKFATNDQYNSIDSPHGKRTFASKIKAINKTVNQESEFIADNYAIEETRRASVEKNITEESTYDENIFIFEILRIATNDDVRFEIGHTAVNGTNVGRVEEFINAKLTPRHMAARWKNYIFATQNKNPFNFISGEVNYKSTFEVAPQEYTEAEETIYSLQTFEENNPQTENDPILYQHAKFNAEKITFSYPLTIAQYQAVKANPYGLICANGIYGWILDFKYKFEDGMADFTLIEKN